MENMKFKTTIRCSGCLEKVTPILNSTQGIERWDVDLKNPDKVLSVVSPKAVESEIVSALKNAGIEIEKL